MPRRYYSRRTRVIRPKRKWATNFKQGSLSAAQGGAVVLVENAAQSSSPTPVIVKAGNFKIQGDVTVIYNQASAAAQITLFVFFLPEGIDVDASAAQMALNSHPEWIMAWKQLDTNGSPNAATLDANGFSFSSRLKRNLNSGDRICLGFRNDVATANISIKYSCQYWTCAN